MPNNDISELNVDTPETYNCKKHGLVVKFTIQVKAANRSGETGETKPLCVYCLADKIDELFPDLEKVDEEL